MTRRQELFPRIVLMTDMTRRGRIEDCGGFPESASFFTARMTGPAIASPTLRRPWANRIAPTRPLSTTPTCRGSSLIARAGQT